MKLHPTLDENYLKKTSETPIILFHFSNIDAITFYYRVDFINNITTLTFILFAVWAVLMTSETILNLTVLMRKNEDICILYQRIPEYYNGNIVSHPILKVLHINKNKKYGFI